MRKGYIKYENALYQKFYMGMIFCEGRYYEKDEHEEWYSVGIDKDGYPDFGDRVHESNTGMGSEPQ